MLPAKFRLKIQSGKKAVWRDKKELYTPHFKMIYRAGEMDNPPKIGFIVSGKVGRAAQRNRLRRRLSEAVRSRIENFPSGIEVLVIGNKNAPEVSYEEVCTSLDRILPKIHFPGR